MIKQSPEQPPSNQESVYDRIKNLRGAALEKIGDEEFYERMGLFAKKIQNRHPDYQKYKCYHALIGSDLLSDFDSIDEDFEGEDSVESFLESILEE